MNKYREDLFVLTYLLHLGAAAKSKGNTSISLDFNLQRVAAINISSLFPHSFHAWILLRFYSITHPSLATIIMTNSYMSVRLLLLLLVLLLMNVGAGHARIK